MKSNLPHLYPHLPNSEHTTEQPEPSLVFFTKKKQVLENQTTWKTQLHEHEESLGPKDKALEQTAAIQTQP